MENASKALLIAGAILICILLIGIGMLVYQSAQGTVSEAISQMSSQEKDMFNQQFTQYAGKRVNGSNVRALLQKVKNNNNTNAGTPDKQVAVVSAAIKAEAGSTAVEGLKTDDNKDISSTVINKVNTAGTYIVEYDDKNKDGLIDEINITQYKPKTE